MSSDCPLLYSVVDYSNFVNYCSRGRGQGCENLEHLLDSVSVLASMERVQHPIQDIFATKDNGGRGGCKFECDELHQHGGWNLYLNCRGLHRDLESELRPWLGKPIFHC